jgi:uncharacterized protein (TIGR02145 family)
MNNIFRISGVIILIFLINSCKKITPTLPIVTTLEVSSITTNSAISRGSVTSSGADVILCGVCWSTSQNPDTVNFKTNDSPGVGNFTSSLTGLAPNTTYYLRAYAMNRLGISYGNELNFKTYAAIDSDGNGYYSVKIGTQVWLEENLKTTKYNDGTAIPNVPDQYTWSWQTTTGAYCNYNNDESYASTYGRLYNWYAVNTGKLCPEGWHVPTDDEWKTLEDYLIANGFNYDGTISENKIAKSLASKNDWYRSTETGAVGNTDYPDKRNVTGFTGFPSGSRLHNFYTNFSYYTMWWSSSEFGHDIASGWGICWSNSDLIRNTLSEKYGLSVRCLKDNK